jgi:hypothetical protein
MKHQENHIVKEKTKVKALPGNVKLVIGKSMNDKLEHAKAISASITGFKKQVS